MFIIFHFIENIFHFRYIYLRKVKIHFDKMNKNDSETREFTIEKALGRIRMSYDEKVKDPKIKRGITHRWRLLGLTEGLKPNSKSEKNTIEGYERMAICLIGKDDGNGNIGCTCMFQTVIFPMMYLMYGTGEKLTGKKLYSVVKAEEIYEVLEHTTMNDVMDYVKERVPKACLPKIQLMSHLMNYKKISDIPITQLDYNHLELSDDEHGLLTALFQEEGKRGFDFEANLTMYIPSYLVFYFSEKKKREECEE